MTTVEIKARLFELQSHVCNGRMSIPRQPGDHGCEGCSEYVRPAALLREEKEVKEASK